MKEFALELCQPFNGWPAPVVKNTRCIDEDVAFDMEISILYVVAYLDVPLLSVPAGAYHLMLQVNVFLEFVLITEPLEVTIELC